MTIWKISVRCILPCILYSSGDIAVVTQYYEEFYEVLLCGELVGSVKGRNNRSSVILARWFKGGLDMESLERRPGELEV